MKLCWARCAAFLALLCTSTALVFAGIREQQVSYVSTALGGPTTYTVLLPDPLPQQKVPVLYLLHGWDASHRVWLEKTSITQVLDGRGWAVVMPDGGKAGWWLNHDDSGPKYADFVTEEVRLDAESRFPIRTDRAGRAIAGLSMGGHGAFTNAMRRPDLYASASSISGILNLASHPRSWGLPEIFGPIAKNRPRWKQASFIGMLDGDAPTSGAVALMFDCGSEDTAALADNRRAHEMLTNRAIIHTYQELKGLHNWDFWRARLSEHLDFHERVRMGADGLAKVVPAGRFAPEKWRDAYSSRTLSYERENAEKWIPIATNPKAPPTSRPIVLLGSSSFEISDVRSLLPGEVVAYRGISADRIGMGERGILHRLYCSAIDLRPRAVFLLNGTNDIGMMFGKGPGAPTLDEIIATYREVVIRLTKSLPKARIFIVSLSPTRDNYAKHAAVIPDFNRRIRDIVTDLGNPNVEWVDSYPLLVGPDGQLLPEYSRDGLHLNKAGYAILGRVMRSALYTKSKGDTSDTVSTATTSAATEQTTPTQ